MPTAVGAGGAPWRGSRPPTPPSPPLFPAAPAPAPTGTSSAPRPAPAQPPRGPRGAREMCARFVRRWGEMCVRFVPRRGRGRDVRPICTGGGAWRAGATSPRWNFRRMSLVSTSSGATSSCAPRRPAVTYCAQRDETVAKRSPAAARRAQRTAHKEPRLGEPHRAGRGAVRGEAWLRGRARSSHSASTWGSSVARAPAAPHSSRPSRKSV